MQDESAIELSNHSKERSLVREEQLFADLQQSGFSFGTNASRLI
jgi:hypothetical protein